MIVFSRLKLPSGSSVKQCQAVSSGEGIHSGLATFLSSLFGDPKSLNPVPVQQRAAIMQGASAQPRKGAARARKESEARKESAEADKPTAKPLRKGKR